MARVLPERRGGSRFKKEKGPTALQQAIQGVNLAGGVVNLAGNLGKLFYPGGITGAIEDKLTSGASEEDVLAERARLRRKWEERAASARGRSPLSGMSEPWQAPATSPLEQEGAPRPRPEPTPQSPVTVSMEQLRDAARRARDAGSIDEFREWVQMAVTQRALNIEGMTDLQKLELERTLEAQRGAVSQRGLAASGDDIPDNFNDVLGKILKARSVEAVDDLVAFAARIAPTRDTRGSKTREMERIESAAQARREELSKRGFPSVDFEDLADIGYREGRADLYKRRPSGGGKRAPKRDHSRDLKGRLNTALNKLLAIGGSPAEVKGLNKDLQNLTSQLDELSYTQPLINMTSEQVGGLATELEKSTKDAERWLTRMAEAEQGALAADQRKFDLKMFSPEGDGLLRSVPLVWDPDPRGTDFAAQMRLVREQIGTAKEAAKAVARARRSHNTDTWKRGALERKIKAAQTRIKSARKGTKPSPLITEVEDILQAYGSQGWTSEQVNRARGLVFKIDEVIRRRSGDGQ
jgi:hypothetical protein